jgi:hypothetical protein
MKVTEKNKRVGSLENGSVFEHEGAFYMVTDKGNGRCTVCVDVNTGECADFPIDKEVKLRLAEVIIMNDVE